MAKTVMRYLLQVVNYVIFIALIGYFSAAPSYQQLADDESVITVAFGHAGQPREPCRKLSQEELLKLPPNMRKAEECPRERSPVMVEVLIDDKLAFSETVHPPGLFEDGSVDIFSSTRVKSGSYKVAVRMNDSVRVEGYTHTAEYDVTLEPGQLVVVKFNTKDGFTIK